MVYYKSTNRFRWYTNFSKVNINMAVTSLDCVRAKISVLYVTTWSAKSNHQKTHHKLKVSFAPARFLAYVSSFAKVFVKSTIPWMCQGITDFAETETLPNKTSVGANVSFRLMATKKITGFSRMRKTVNLLCFGYLLQGNMLMGGLRSCFVTYKIYLLTLALSRLAIGLLCLRFTSEKTSLWVFVSYHPIQLHVLWPMVHHSM